MTNHIPLLEAACTFFQEYLSDKNKSFLAQKYGFTTSTIKQHRIGYAPVDTWELPVWLLEQGFTSSDIRTSGLVWVSDDTGNCGSLMRGRIMFPYLINGNPTYFIGRLTDETPSSAGNLSVPKYKKMKTRKDQQGNIITPQEPIFGIDSVQENQPLIITEGIADCISAHQVGFAAISPGTIRFKEDHVNEVQRFCKKASRTYIIMDNEKNAAGEQGAIDTGLKLSRCGILPYIATIPKPENIQKIDLNDYIRDGGDVMSLFSSSVYVEDHPIAKEIIRNEWKRAATAMSNNSKHQYPHEISRETIHTTFFNADNLKAALPPLRDLVGFEGRGPHPVYGSSSGQNLDVTGDLWCCFHKGHEGGGDILKWIACYELHLIQEDEDNVGDVFMQTCRYVADKYLKRPLDTEILN